MQEPIPSFPCALQKTTLIVQSALPNPGLLIFVCDSVHCLCLQDQALTALRAAVDTFERPVFPCALIAGDVVLLHLLHELGYLADKRVTVVFIDTFHLFSETHTFLHQLEVSRGHGFRVQGLGLGRVCLECAADTGLVLEAGIPHCGCGTWAQWALHIGSTHPWLAVGAEVPWLCRNPKGWDGRVGIPE